MVSVILSGQCAPDQSPKWQLYLEHTNLLLNPGSVAVPSVALVTISRKDERAAIRRTHQVGFDLGNDEIVLRECVIFSSSLNFDVAALHDGQWGKQAGRRHHSITLSLSLSLSLFFTPRSVQCWSVCWSVATSIYLHLFIGGFVLQQLHLGSVHCEKCENSYTS